MIRRLGLILAALVSVVSYHADAQGFRPGFRPGLQFVTPAPTEDPDVTAYVAKLSPAPSSTERSAINTLVVGLKTDGVWNNLDRIGLFAVETAQASLVDLRNPSKSYTTGGTITFTANRGWTGDGSTGYLDIGEPWATSGNQFALNSAVIGGWCNATSTTTGFKALFGNISGNARSQINARDNGGNENFRFNDSTDDIFMASNGSRLGHRAALRTAATVKKGFFNGALVANLTTASNAVSITNGTALRSNTTGFSDDRIALIYSGSGNLTDNQMAAIDTRFRNYLTAKGAN